MKLRCIEKTIVNDGRQIEVDLAKAFGIVCMVICHTAMYTGLPLDSWLNASAREFFGGPVTAPMFMFCMGIGISYSKRNAPALMAKRGLKLLLTGYVFNFARNVLLPILAVAAGAQINLSSLPEYAFQTDILLFAGMAFLALALLKRLRLPNAAALCVAVVCSIVGKKLAFMSTGSGLLDIAAALVWGDGVYSLFPLLNWLIYPAAGIVFGDLLRRCGNRDRFYGIVCVCGAVCMPAMLLETEMLTSVAAYYYHGILSAVGFLGMICFELGILHFLNKILGSGIRSLAASLSGNIESIYCIHWEMVILTRMIVLYFLPTEVTRTYWVYLLIACILPLSVLGARWWRAHKADFRV